MRAIWSQEDPQQRLLRLKKLGLRIPARCLFAGTFGSTTYTGKKYGLTLDDLLDEIIKHELTDIDENEQELEKRIKDELQRKEDEMRKIACRIIILCLRKFRDFGSSTSDELGELVI